jgi:hypothetical protein
MPYPGRQKPHSCALQFANILARYLAPVLVTFPPEYPAAKRQCNNAGMEPLTKNPCPDALESSAASIASATASGVFTSSPARSQASEMPEVRCVVVKNGAMAFTRIPCFCASVCEARSNPTTPCFDAVYARVPAPSKYPAVEATRTIERGLSGGADLRWWTASLSAARQLIFSS